MIPTKKQLQSRRYRFINGEWHKRCAGPAHEEPVWLPSNEKYFYLQKSGEKNGKLLAWCRLCSNWNNLKVRTPLSEQGYVRAEDVRPLFQEAVTRCGVNELSRRTGVSRDQLVEIIQGRTTVVRKKTVKAVLLELISMKRKKEFPINPQAAFMARKRLNGDAVTCAGCGTLAANFTEGCKLCWDRHKRRKVRGKADVL